MSDMHYVGSELTLFRNARRWKRYVASQLAPYVRGDVLEVGAGIGGTTPFVHSRSCRSWTCLEPDPELATELSQAVAGLGDAAGHSPTIRIGDTRDLSREQSFDCVLYLDVLEHIEDDEAELERGLSLLRRGGRLVVLSPAWSWLYSAFDHAIGHCRRYSRSALLARAPRTARLVQARYLDSAGILASLANRILMRQAMPTVEQVAAWDRWLVPVSRLLDAPLGYRVGKSILAAWESTDASR